jgi:hypothetical protein
MAQKVGPILLQLFSSPLSQTPNLTHTPLVLGASRRFSTETVVDLAVECFVGFLVSNFWSTGNFDDVALSVYSYFVTQTEIDRTQKYVNPF